MRNNILLLGFFVVFVILIYPIVFLASHHHGIFFIIKNYSFTMLFDCFIHHHPLTIKSLMKTLVISAVSLAGLVFLTLRPKKVNIHGNARFANRREIQPFADAKDGIVIGIYQKRILRFPGPQFVAVCAPTRSGKGVAIVVPNLLEQTCSAVVMDIPKMEGFMITSRYRKDVLKQKVFLFSPFLRGSSKYNPLDYVDFSSGLADVHLNSIASVLYPADPKDFFANQARELFVGMALFVHDLIEHGLLKKPFSMSTILEASSIINDTPFEEYFTQVKLQDILSDGALLRLERFVSNSSDNTKAGIKSSFELPLGIFSTSVVAENTSSSDFDLRLLRKEKMTIYVSMDLEQLVQAHVLINLFWSQLLIENTRKLPEHDRTLKHKCVLVLDEFTSIGKIDILQKGTAFIAGYGLQMLTIFQSKSQLAEPPPMGYGPHGAQTLITNHAVEVVYATKEKKDAAEYSERLGYRDVVDNNVSRNSGNIHKNINETKQKRALMLPQEIQEMDFDEEILFIEGHKPIKCNKAFYFLVPEFLNKLRQVSPTLKSIKNPKKSHFDHAFQKGETRIGLDELTKLTWNISVKN